MRFLDERVPKSGSPAHAGIDPRRRTISSKVEGFPRTRGDRPLCPGVLLVVLAVPPHTRG